MNRWGRNVPPVSLLGNATWSDVSVAVDVLLPGSVPAPKPKPPPAKDVAPNWRNSFSGLCLDTKSDATADGSTVDVWTCVAKNNEAYAHDAASGPPPPPRQPRPPMGLRLQCQVGDMVGCSTSGDAVRIRTLACVPFLEFNRTSVTPIDSRVLVFSFRAAGHLVGQQSKKCLSTRNCGAEAGLCIQKCVAGKDAWELGPSATTGEQARRAPPRVPVSWMCPSVLYGSSTMLGPA